MSNAPVVAAAPAAGAHMIAHLCLANAHRDERQPEYRYGKRHAQFVIMMGALKQAGVSVVSLKELRACLGDDDMPWTAYDQAAKLAAAGGFVLASCDAVKVQPSTGVARYEPFHMAQLYDARRLAKVDVRVERAYAAVYGSDTSAEHCGACTLLVRYAPLRGPGGFPDLSQAFTVATDHFPMREDAKLRAAQNLNVLNVHGPVVHIGDYNLFADDALRDAIYAELTRKLRDATTHLVDETGRVMYGTFFPYPHDKPPVRIAPPHDPRGASRLDYAFVSDDVRVYGACVMACHEEALPLSDHLPLLLRFDLRSVDAAPAAVAAV